jgi:uncharacterized protein DUF1707/cell wall-active antibiotic response 4TMS protein YvqF
MTDPPALRASDAEREQVVARLRDASADGRLTLEEFTDRMTSAYDARTHDELERLVSDVPAHGDAAPAVSRRRPTRWLLALFGSTERAGHLRAHGRIACLMGFGNIDLDLRQATLEGEVITIVALGAFGAIDVYVPEGVEVDMSGFALFGHARANGNDPPPRPGTPLVRVYAFSLWAGIDVWRVPLAWSQRTWREVIKGIRRGEHKELGA